jgi:hypothetical protein
MVPRRQRRRVAIDIAGNYEVVADFDLAGRPRLHVNVGLARVTLRDLDIEA